MNIALPDGAEAVAACVRRCGAVPAYCALCRRLAAAEAAAERAPAACPALVRRTLFRHRLLELQARAYAAGLLLLGSHNNNSARCWHYTGRWRFDHNDRTQRQTGVVFFLPRDAMRKRGLCVCQSRVLYPND